MEKQEKKYNLKNDIIFKTFFSRKGNEEFLIDFLNSLLKIEIVKIEIQEEVSIEQLATEEKGGRLDLQATLNDGIIVNIELQMRDEHNIQERSLLYASKVISRETARGTKYEDIKNIIMINILGYNIFECEDYISKTAIVLDKHREYEVMDNIQWYYIELPKFREQNPDMNEKINQWIAFIDGEREELIKVAEKKNKTLQKAREEMNYLTGDAAVRRLAELREKWDMDYNSGISYAKKEGIRQGLKDGIKQGLKDGIKQGLKDGIKQGLKDGIKQGLKDGIEQGLKEGEKNAAKNTAKKMLNKNMDIEEIMELTGLSREEIEELKNEK